MLVRAQITFPLIQELVQKLFEGNLPPLKWSDAQTQLPQSRFISIFASLLWVATNFYPPMRRLSWVSKLQPSPRLRFAIHTLGSMLVSVLFTLLPYMTREQLVVLLLLNGSSLLSVLRVFTIEVSGKVDSAASGGEHG